MSVCDLVKIDIEWGSESLVRAQQIVEKRPYEVEQWTGMIRAAQCRPINEVRTLFESLIAVFPTTARYWKIYIDMEIKARNYERVEKLFQRCLVKILNIDLWKLYLSYVKDTKSGLSTYKEKMAQAYDFALEKIGMDLNSFSIWQDYIQFLRGVEAVGSYAENQKITAVRRVYQRAVITPIIGIEQLWKDYIAFEQQINPVISEKMNAERSKDYINARRVAKELENITKGLNRNMPAVPPILSKEETKQVEIWKRFINYERSNPLRTEDSALITRRVMFATEQCLLVLSHHAAVWHQAAQFLEQSARSLSEKGDTKSAKILADECANILERSINGVLNKNALLAFAYADYEEGRMKYEKVHAMYKKLLAMPDIDPTLVYIQYMKFCRRAEGIKSARTIFKAAREDQRSRYHAFVAAALMEYYCSKDKDIAFRIFELGLKRFNSCPEYVMCYIDYLSHLNEDNNTRVLFERILSSGGLLERSIEIWNRFLEFESNVGDLASVVKVERRRQIVLENLKEFEGKETAQLVDRYKFLDLYPCSPTELNSIGYTTTTQVAAKSNGARAKDEELDIDKTIAVMKRPDFTQMIPYKPTTKPYTGSHPVPGGIFPPPPALAALGNVLPPPNSFHGPFISVEILMDLLQNYSLKERSKPDADHATQTRFIEQTKPHQWAEGTAFSNGRRRRFHATGNGGPAGDDSDDESQLVTPPTNDVYRIRQLKRLCK